MYCRDLPLCFANVFQLIVRVNIKDLVPVVQFILKQSALTHATGNGLELHPVSYIWQYK